MLWCLLGGQIFAISICVRRQPNHVKHLLSGLYNLLKVTFHWLIIIPGDPRGMRSSHFRSDFPPRYSFFRWPESAPGGHMRVVTRHWGRISASEPCMNLGFPASALFRTGRPRTNCLLWAKYFCYSTEFRSSLYSAPLVHELLQGGLVPSKTNFD